MYNGLKIGKYHITGEIARLPDANYLLGGFIKYYTDAKHPDYIGGEAPPVRQIQIRADFITHLAEVRISNVKRKRRD